MTGESTYIRTQRWPPSKRVPPPARPVAHPHKSASHMHKNASYMQWTTSHSHYRGEPSGLTTLMITRVDASLYHIRTAHQSFELFSNMDILVLYDWACDYV